MYKQFIKDTFIRSDGKLNNQKIKKFNLTAEYIYLEYNQIIKPICRNCNKTPTFISFSKGYRTFCSSKCANNDRTKINSAIENTDYKNISEKLKNFNRTHEYNTEINDKRIITNLARYGVSYVAQVPEIKDKITKTNLIRYGATTYLNSIEGIDKSKETKLKRYNNPQYNNPLAIKNKERITKITLGIWKTKEEYKLQEIYYKAVHKYTKMAYKKYKHIINPSNLKRGNNTWHLDHKLSIIDGFHNNILPCIIGSVYNLEMLWCKENLMKHYKSSIIAEDLYKLYYGNKIK